MGECTNRVDEEQAFVCPKATMRLVAAAAISIGLALSVAGCGKDSEDVLFPRNEKAAGALVSVSGGETALGFAGGRVRDSEVTESFSISKYPITRKQYGKCEEAGVCDTPSLTECSDPELAKAARDGDSDAAAICVGLDNAERFCKWVGGRLPTLGEWLRAARGPSVQHFSWGAAPADCGKHPGGGSGPGSVLSSENVRKPTPCSDVKEDRLRTARHEAGASLYGFQDALLTPAELVSNSSASPHVACLGGQPCVVFSRDAGAIDGIAPYAVLGANQREGEEPLLLPKAYGFRCVVKK